MNDNICRTRPFKCFAINATVFIGLLAASFTGFLHLDTKIDKVYDKINDIYEAVTDEHDTCEHNKTFRGVKASDNL